MDNTLDQNNPDIKENDNICGYLIKKIVELKEIRSILYDIEHTATGFGEKKLRNIIFRLNRIKKIKRKSRGVYIVS